MPANDSSTGGPLLPEGTQPIEGQALNRFLQGWIVGILGIASTLVRPAWQAEPANIPNAGDYWVALGIHRRPNDTYTTTIHVPTADGGLGADVQVRHESIELLSSFYDLGVNGQADVLCSQLADGVQVAQNRELLDLNGFAVVEASNPTAVPSLFKERWQYRVDLSIVMRRQTQRQYPVRNLVSAHGTIVFDDHTPTVNWQTK